MRNLLFRPAAGNSGDVKSSSTFDDDVALQRYFDDGCPNCRESVDELPAPAPKRARRGVCPVRTVMGLAIVTITCLGLAHTTPEAPGAYGFGISNLAGVFLLSSWKRKPKGRCWLKSATMLVTVLGCAMIPIALPAVTTSAFGLLCIAGALLICMPATPYLANRTQLSR
jgi:hypothetical protein